MSKAWRAPSPGLPREAVAILDPPVSKERGGGAVSSPPPPPLWPCGALGHGRAGVGAYGGRWALAECVLWASCRSAPVSHVVEVLEEVLVGLVEVARVLGRGESGLLQRELFVEVAHVLRRCLQHKNEARLATHQTHTRAHTQ